MAVIDSMVQHRDIAGLKQLKKHVQDLYRSGEHEKALIASLGAFENFPSERQFFSLIIVTAQYELDDLNGMIVSFSQFAHYLKDSEPALQQFAIFFLNHGKTELYQQAFELYLKTCPDDNGLTVVLCRLDSPLLTAARAISLNLLAQQGDRTCHGTLTAMSLCYLYNESATCFAVLETILSTSKRAIFAYEYVWLCAREGFHLDWTLVQDQGKGLRGAERTMWNMLVLAREGKRLRQNAPPLKILSWLLADICLKNSLTSGQWAERQLQVPKSNVRQLTDLAFLSLRINALLSPGMITDFDKAYPSNLVGIILRKWSRFL